MTAKPRGARRILTITHPDNTTSTRSTTADYLYGVERGPVDSERWARNLELRAIEADTQADNAEALLKDGFKTLRRHRRIGNDNGYNDYELIVETKARTTPDIGESVHTYCNYERESRDYVRDADGNPVRADDGQWTEIVRPGVEILRESLERLSVRRREYAAWLREQIAAGPSEEERSYTVLRWSKSYELAAKAAQGAEFAHHRAAGHPLTVVKVDQAHEGHEPGVYISPADRQAARRAATIAAVDATALPIPTGQNAADEGDKVAVILDETDPAAEQVERSVCRYCHGRIVRRTHRPGTKWRHDKGDKGSPRGCTPFSQYEATPTDITAEYRVISADDHLADLAERLPIGTDAIVGSGERYTVRGHTARHGEPSRVVTDRGEWLAEECRPVRPVVHVDITEGTTDRGSVLVTNTGREQSPQAYISRNEGVWSLDSEYTDNDGSVAPVRLTASTLPYVVNAFLTHLGLNPRDVDHRLDNAPVLWTVAEDTSVHAGVSPSALAAAVMTWNADRTMTAARWNFNSSKNFAARLFGQFAAVVEIDEAMNAYEVTVRDVLTGTAVKRERATGDDVLESADRLLRQARRNS